MRIVDLDEQRDGNTAVATARILPTCTDSPLTLRFAFEGVDGPLDGLGDALAVALLAPAMFEGEALHIEGAVSNALLDNLQQAQAVLSTWYDFLTPIEVSADLVEPSNVDACATGIAACFTGGVDSWYSLLKHQSRISHLLLVRGFDIGLDNDVLWDDTRYRAQVVARSLGMRLITCTTNLRPIADKRRSGWGRTCEIDFWGRCLHGAAIASVALTMRHDLRELIVPASHTYAHIFPWGSSPLLDPLWSNGHLTVRHDGCEAGRLEKTHKLAAHPLALETLRVCFADTSSYNCGKCEKCLRTMMALRACGALDRARTFAAPLDLGRVHRLRVPSQAWSYYEEIVAAARRSGDHALWRAAEVAIGRSFSVRHAVSVVRGAAGSGWWRTMKPRLTHLAGTEIAKVPSLSRNVEE